MRNWAPLPRNLDTIYHCSLADFLPDIPFIPLDLSQCTRLRTLQLPLLFNKPEMFSGAISSITSPGLSTIVLYLAFVSGTRVDHQRWKILEESLCQLAKQFRTLRGEKMLVEINLKGCGSTVLPPLIDDGGLLSHLGEEARMVISVDEQESVNPYALALSDEFADFYWLNDEANYLDPITGSLTGTSLEPIASGASPCFLADVCLSDDDFEAHWWGGLDIHNSPAPSY